MHLSCTETYLLRFAGADPAFALPLSLESTTSISESESSGIAGFFRLAGGVGFFSSAMSTSESDLILVGAFFAGAFFGAGVFSFLGAGAFAGAAVFCFFAGGAASSSSALAVLFPLVLGASSFSLSDS